MKSFTSAFLSLVAAVSFLVFSNTLCSAQDKSGEAKPSPTAKPVAPTPAEAQAKGGNPVVLMKTSFGNIKIELWEDKTPITVKNFLRYVDEKFYDGTIFHRVMPDFMIQGGGFTPDMKEKNSHEPIENEAKSDVKNERGTLAMARTGVVDSATAQFFINVVDNTFLNHRDETPRGFGYAVFGKVLEGMDVVDKIKAVPTTTKGPYENVPSQPVVIESVTKAGK
jgi:peptidyl-prolyl cis-trans isomerase B (cyclophilin B)